MKTFVLTENSKMNLPPRTKIVGWEDFAESAVQTRDESLWITEDLDDLMRTINEFNEDFFKHQIVLRKHVNICLLADVPIQLNHPLEGLFKEAIILSQDSALPIKQLIEVLTGKHPERYVIGGQADEITHTVTLIRGNLDPLVVPLSTFRSSDAGIAPDFSKFKVDDYGQTLKFGKYEASVDSILYEFDPLYRRKRKAELAKKDKSFGASLRRLRLQKGLRQTDFADIDEREIGRIERGEVKPRKATLEKLAQTLGVMPSDIKTY